MILLKPFYRIKYRLCFMAVIVCFSFLKANDTPFMLETYETRDFIGGYPVKILKFTALKNNIKIKSVVGNEDNCDFTPTGNWKLNLNYGDYTTLRINCSNLIKVDIDSNVGAYT